MMRLVCAWCGVGIDRPGYGETLSPDTSHGMCPACSEALACEQRGASLHEYLNTVPIPVLLMDDSNAVVSMNAKASETLGKKLDGAEIQFFGKIFDCAHSRSSEGCGRSIHCSGCVIRRCVTVTFDTGEPQIMVPATLTTASPDDLSAAVLVVTTVKVGGFVLLRLE